MTRLARESENGIKLDINFQHTESGDTSLHLAAQQSQHEMVQFLFEEEVDLFRRNAKHQTAFTQTTNNLLMVKLLKKQERRFFKNIFGTSCCEEKRLRDKRMFNTLNSKYNSFSDQMKGIKVILDLENK